MSNKRDQAILDWTQEHRPDLLPQVRKCLTPERELQETIYALMSIGFEAGREFQVNNPEVPLNSPSHYLQGRW